MVVPVLAGLGIIGSMLGGGGAKEQARRREYWRNRRDEEFNKAMEVFKPQAMQPSMQPQAPPNMGGHIGPPSPQQMQQPTAPGQPAVNPIMEGQMAAYSQARKQADAIRSIAGPEAAMKYMLGMQESFKPQASGEMPDTIAALEGKTPDQYTYAEAWEVYNGDMGEWHDDAEKARTRKRLEKDAELNAITAATNLANARNDRAAEKITNLWSKETDSINQWRDNPSTRYESDVMDKPPPNRLLRNDMRYAIDLARSGEASSAIFGDYRGAGVAEIKAWFGDSFENLMKGLAGDFAFSLISDRGDPRPSDKDVAIMSGRFSSSPLGVEEATRRLINIDSSMYIDTAGIDSIKRYRTQLIHKRETAVNELMGRAENMSYDQFAREMSKIKNEYARTNLDQFMDHQKYYADKIYDEFLYNHLDRSENGEINPDMFYIEPEVLKELEADSKNEDGILDLQLLYQRLAVYKETSWQNARVVMQ